MKIIKYKNTYFSVKKNSNLTAMGCCRLCYFHDKACIAELSYKCLIFEYLIKTSSTSAMLTSLEKQL
jgi:hypothetical protein